MSTLPNPGIRVAVFDIGNVLLRFNYLVAAERFRLLNALDDLPPEETIVQAKHLLEVGEIPRSRFLEIVKPAFAHQGDDESFLEIWRDIFFPNHHMIEFARALARKMPVCLLSNISCIHHEFIFERFEFFRIFQHAAMSYQLGALKPSPEIYQRALVKFDAQPGEVVLFDDLPDNVAAARSLGWNALLYDFRDHNRFLEEARLLGLTP